MFSWRLQKDGSLKFGWFRGGYFRKQRSAYVWPDDVEWFWYEAQQSMKWTPDEDDEGAIRLGNFTGGYMRQVPVIFVGAGFTVSV